MKSTPKRISFALPMLLIVLAALGLSSTAAAQQIVEDMWTDGAFDGKWSTAGNWTNGVPDNTSGVVYNVTIPASGFNQGPILDFPVTINNLTINSSAVNVNATVLGVSGTSIAINNGALNLNLDLSHIILPTLIINSNVTLSGAGMLNMINGMIDGSGTLFNQSTIQGDGYIGSVSSSFTLNNSGIINATNPTSGVLSIQSKNGSLTNTGTLKGTNGSLHLNSNIQNAGGKIGGIVLLAAAISGGTLSSGNISTGSSGATLNGVTLDFGCQYKVSDGSTTVLQGAIANNGQILLQRSTTGGPTSLFVDSTVTLSGTGTVTTTGSTNNLIEGTGTLVISSPQLVDSGLTISVQTVTNQSVINTAGYPILIQPQSGGFTNTGTVEGTEGGSWNVSGGIFANTNGTTSGTLSGPGTFTGGVTVEGGSLLNPMEAVKATFDSTTFQSALSGVLSINSGDQAIFKGKFLNNGAINMSAVNCSNPCSPAMMDLVAT